MYTLHQYGVSWSLPFWFHCQLTWTCRFHMKNMVTGISLNLLFRIPLVKNTWVTSKISKLFRNRNCWRQDTSKNNNEKTLTNYLMVFNSQHYHTHTRNNFTPKEYLPKLENSQNNKQKTLKTERSKKETFKSHTLIFASSGPLLESATLVPCFSLCL